MVVNYDDFAKKFAESRKNMKWQEIDYFVSNYLKWSLDWKNILDVGCWSGRLTPVLNSKNSTPVLVWVDLSKELLKEAKKNYPKNHFFHLNMLDLDKIYDLDLQKELKEKIKNWFDYIFFIASFHHLDSLEDRKKVLQKTYNILKNDWIVFMTNWALNSEINKEKYFDSIIKWTKNEFWSLDYNIKFWKNFRYYHCFSLEELEYLFRETWFKILENRLFDNKRNFISIIQKKWD